MDDDTWILDQAKAATNDLRKHMEKLGLGSANTPAIDEEPPEWMTKIIFRCLQLGKPCQHLIEINIQPAYCAPNELIWRCQKCFDDLKLEDVQIISETEEHVCDRCRTYKPGELIQTIIQMGPWLFITGICFNCVGEFEKEGGSIISDVNQKET